MGYNTDRENGYFQYLHNKSCSSGIPFSGTFELTSRCNFNCSMCYVHSAGCSKEYLSADDWKNIAGKAAEHGMLELLLTGGEPLIRDDFDKIYLSLIEMGLVISLNTNASLLTEEKKKLLAEYPPARMNISLYGADNKTYENMCGVPAFDTVSENIIWLKNEGIPVKINSTVTSKNCRDIEKTIDFAKKIDVPIKNTTYIFPRSREYHSDKNYFDALLTAKESAQCRMRFLEYSKTRGEFYDLCRRMTSGIETENVHACSEDGLMKCRAGKDSFWIDFSGKMSFCGLVPGKFDVLSLGFEKCWESVKNQCRAIRLPSECDSCPDKSFCGVCAASCFCEKGVFDKVPDYMCEMTKTMKKIACDYSIMSEGDGIV
ncbi:MAG: radical SAM protein [Clostridiales bacterium]|nr:radical SAM protein [Clostridiales bacterium]